jgi:HAD superfamily hydrolase (TIGR01509 family)
MAAVDFDDRHGKIGVAIAAVIFDRDGVLTYFDLEAAAAYFRPLLPLPLDDLFRRWETWGTKVGFPRSVEEESRFFRGFWDSIAEELHLSATVRAQLHQYHYVQCMRAFPEARAALLEAHRQSLRVGVLSNFSLATLDESLAATELADLVDAACAATVIGAAKPAPEAYLHVSRVLGVAPTDCLLFDDEMECVEGARAVGMHAYWVDRKRAGHAIQQGIVRDLSALPAILQLALAGIGRYRFSA